MIIMEFFLRGSIRITTDKLWIRITMLGHHYRPTDTFDTDSSVDLMLRSCMSEEENCGERNRSFEMDQNYNCLMLESEYLEF